MVNINDEGFLELSGIHQSSGIKELTVENFPILEGLSPLSLRVLSQASRTIHVAKGVQLMLTGDTPHDLYFISEGKIAIAKEQAGKVKVVAQLNRGDFYGEYGVLRGKTRFASVYTAEPSVIIRVDLNAIQQVLDGDQTFRERMMKRMKERILHSFLFSYSAFRDVSKESREILSTKLAVTTFEREETLFTEGEAAEKYYVILSGEAEIFVTSGQKEVLLEIRRDNGVLGEIRTDKGTKNGYTVRAANQLDLLELDKSAMQLIQQIEPQALQKLNQIMIEQAKKTSALINQLNTER